MMRVPSPHFASTLVSLCMRAQTHPVACPFPPIRRAASCPWQWLWAINGHSGIDVYVQDATTGGEWWWATSSGNNPGNRAGSMAATVLLDGATTSTSFWTGSHVFFWFWHPCTVPIASRAMLYVATMLVGCWLVRAI